jgi:hypothetical protein
VLAGQRVLADRTCVRLRELVVGGSVPAAVAAISVRHRRGDFQLEDASRLIEAIANSQIQRVAALRAVELFKLAEHIPADSVERLTAIVETRSTDPDAVMNACSILAHEPEIPERSISVLLEYTLARHSFRGRAAAIAVLPRTSAVASVLGPLCQLLVDPDQDVRRAAGDAMVQLAHRNPARKEDLVNLLANLIEPEEEPAEKSRSSASQKPLQEHIYITLREIVDAKR